MSLIALRGLTKRYPRRGHRPRRPDARPRARHHRPRRRQRRRQEHAPQDPARAARPDVGRRPRSWASTCAARARRSASSSATCPSTTACRPTRSATDFVTHMARMSGLPRTAARERTAEVLRHVGLYEERYRAIGGYSTGHEAAGQARPGARPRSAAAAPRRADQRPRPGRPRRDARRSSGGPAPSSGSRSSSPPTCSARSSGSATSSWRSTPAGCCGRRRSATFTERTGVLAVEVEEGRGGAGRRARRARPARRRSTAGRSSSPSTDDRPYDLVRDAVADLGLPLVRIEQRRQSLEDLFRDDVPRRRSRRRRRRPAAGRGPMSGRRPSRSRPPTAASGPGGSIYDLGYQSLRRSAAGPAQRGRAPCFAQTLRACFGIGRGGRAKIAPFTLAGAGHPAGRRSRSGSPRSSPRPGRPAAQLEAGVADPLRDVPRPRRRAGHAVLRGPGPGAVRPRPALRRPAALLLAGPDADPTTRSPRSAG